ncbi:MAG TPA: 1,4-alpha-glucan branching protein domain-containing protein [Candidatus Binatia bacterium]|nr:1,4-alpha-glucan branching protein domain-containing protein [Candidatus Binatia bacterium]
MPGSFALILHAHLPFVRHPEHEHFLEEGWFFEAITESYVPLVRMMRRLVDDDVSFKLTMSLTPTLCAMLQDKLLCERYVRHLDLLIDLAARERKRNRKDPQLHELADFYFKIFHETRRFFVDECKCDLLTSFRKLRESGGLEIIASAATHGLLPLLLQQSREAARAQILIGRDIHADLFGVEPAGFWLPECAYAPGLESILQEANIRWFVLDTHGLLFGKPRPHRSIFAPCFTPAGPAAFARDRDSSRQVWSAKGGYPGDSAYREFYRDAGFDLPLEHLGSAVHGTRKFSGVKYHRITGHGDQKELYNPGAAKRVAETQACHFLEERRRQIREVAAAGFDPIVVIPFDAELFGHWWFEGPHFLEQFIRQAAGERDFRLSTSSEYLAANPTQQIIEPATSTWGENGYFEVWLNPSNAWIYPQLHIAAQRMSELARKYASEVVGQPRKHSGLPNAKAAGSAPSLRFADRVLKQLARELLLAQSSDWAFLMKTGTAREYATKRTLNHLVRFNRLRDQLAASRVDEQFLRECELSDNLFPNVNWRYYA